MGGFKPSSRIFLFFFVMAPALCCGSVSVQSTQVVFEGETPTFKMQTVANSAQEMHWQISSDPDFLDEDLIFEDVSPFTAEMVLPAIAEGLLPEQGDLFFRGRIAHEGRWNAWSDPEPFFIIRPKAPGRNSKVSDEVWKQVVPYLLPDSHPMKPALDRIFSADRVTLSIKTMKKAGFVNPSPRKWTHLVVTTHPEVPGVIFKLFLDVQRYYKGKAEHVHWLERIRGAQALQAELATRGWNHLFKVPRKWIYPLPEEPSPPRAFIRKDFILVEEDMDIFDSATNYEKWKSEWVTTAKLDAVYTLLKQYGLHDCAKPDNIPFSRDGKIAFVDTQTLYQWPVLYKKLTPYLAPPMQAYWKALTKE